MEEKEKSHSNTDVYCGFFCTKKHPPQNALRRMSYVVYWNAK